MILFHLLESIEIADLTLEIFFLLYILLKFFCVFRKILCLPIPQKQYLGSAFLFGTANKGATDPG